MEKLEGPINPCLFGDHMDVNGLELSYEPFLSPERLRSEEEEPQHFSPQSLEDKMPFLQMLQSVESPPFSPFSEPNFQALLRLQHQKKPLGMTHFTEVDSSRIQALELESCITQDILVVHHSPVKSEVKDQTNSMETGCLETNSGSSSKPKQAQLCKSPQIRERRKRKRTRPTKNKEEVESQRMTHIAVERNRRRQMNDHLNALRSLMPTSYIQRGDQASIIGGAIDFVKELEQLLESLQVQKRMRKIEGGDPTAVGSSSADINPLCPQQQRVSCSDDGNCTDGGEGGGRSEDFTFTAENKSPTADIEVTVIQTHVNLKIQCPRRPGQLLKTIVALEELSLTVLHLNITSLQSSVLYSFNLKIEEDCKLGTADEVATAVHQIFSFINGS